MTFRFSNSLGDIEPKTICFRWKDSYANFTGRVDELNCLEAATINCQDIPDSKSSKIVAVFGLGGIGKTQLVRKFIEKHRTHYKNVIWINAETESSMVDDFTNLAENHLEISTKVEGKLKDVETLLEQVFNKLSTLPTVVVFDNVDETKNTKIIGFVLTSGIRPHVIITSRIQTWSDSICRIKLNVFNDQEALQYVSTKLIDPDKRHNDSDDDKMKLVKTLHRFPLALTQAIALINDLRIAKDFHISDYLCEWNSFLDSKVFKNDDLNTYDQTTLTTWNVTIAKIKKYGATGDLALRILRIISYFDPNHIRRDIFFNLEVPEVHIEREVISAVRLLVNYSMVDGLNQQSVLSVHRLVQQVTKIELESNLDTKISILRDSLDIIWKMRRHPNFKECLDHGISVFCMALTCEKIILKYAKVPAILIKALNDQSKHMRAFNFGIEVTKQLTCIVGENHVNVLDFHLSTTNTFVYLCKYNEALRTYQELLEKQKTVLGENHSKTLKCEANIASTYDRMGKYDEAIQINQSVLEKKKIVLGEDHPQTLLTKSNIGTLYVYVGRYSDALQIHQEVLGQRQTTLGNDHPNTLVSMSHIGCLYSYLGRYSDALQMHQEVFEKRKTVLGEFHTKTLQSESNIADIHFKRGEYSKAFEMHKAVFAKRQTTPMDDYLRLTDCMSNIAIAYSGLGGHSEALQMLQEVSVKLKSLLGEDNRKTLDNLSHIAASYSNIGKHYEALEQHQEVYEKRKHIFGNDHPRTLDSKFHIAILQNTLGKHNLALEMHLEVYSTRKTILGENHPDTLNSISKIADTYSSVGNVTKALELHQEALVKRNIILGESHPHTLNSMSNIAVLYSFQDKYSGAIRMYTEVYEKRKSILGDDHPDTRLDNLLIKLCREDMKSSDFSNFYYLLLLLFLIMVTICVCPILFFNNKVLKI